MDICLRGLALNDQVRFFVASTKDVCEESRVRHQTSATATAALGRALTMTLMMGMTNKGDDTTSLMFHGNGPLGKIVTKSNSRGEVKGYVENPEIDMPRKANGKLDVGSGIGFGTLYVIKDMGLKEPYTGMVPIVTGEVGEDVMEYYYSSEQILSAVGVGVLVDVDYSVKGAGGYMLQLMPEADEETAVFLEKKVQEVNEISSFFEEHTPYELLDIFFGKDYRVLDEKEVSFKCECHKENYAKALATLGKEDLDSLGSEEGVEVVCQFCNEKYLFSAEELKGIRGE